MTNPDHSHLRLRLRRIEDTPKPVRLENWNDFARIGKNPVLRPELDDIIESIGRGDGVPEKYYRSGIDHDRDELLEQRGIMHLHLGGRHSNTLLFLVQYPGLVLLLESNAHTHFQTNPKGRNIVALVQAWFLNLERDLAAAELVAQSTAADKERQAAELHRAWLAASLAKFRREAGERKR